MAIDLRSDTVTRPVPAMRDAIRNAEVGDDVLGDDPTVQRLEHRVADRLGKEAALFTPSGTMANLLAVASQTQPGDEVILDRHAHMLHYETAGAAAVAGVQLATFDASPHELEVDTLRPLRHPEGLHEPRTRLLALENTHNHRGGLVLPVERLRAVADWAHGEGLRVHLDGARLWNACVASGVAPADYAAAADTVTVCFSKGLGAPVGSALAGDAATVQRAHRLRKMLGGGMRQVGILAAAGLYALDHHVDRLAEDHAHAQLLAAAARRASRLDVSHPVETNILLVDLVDPEDDAATLVRELEAAGVLAETWGPRRIRLVTHLDVDRAQVERAAQVLLELRG